MEGHCGTLVPSTTFLFHGPEGTKFVLTLSLTMVFSLTAGPKQDQSITDRALQGYGPK